MAQLIDKLKSLNNSLNSVHSLSVEPPILYVINLCHKTIAKRERFTQTVLFLIKSSLDRMQERINIGHWKDVSSDDRRCITVLSYYNIIAFIELGSLVEGSEVDLEKAFEMLDSGLIFGAPLSDQQEDILHQCASILNTWKQLKQPKGMKQESLLHLNFKNTELTMDLNQKNFVNLAYEAIDNSNVEMSSNCESEMTDSFGITLKKESCPSLESFNMEYFSKKQPVVLLNCMSHWPALHLWSNTDYLLEKAGHRTVPIELGSKYTDSDWTQKLMTVKDFIKEQIINTKPKIGYLAQYQLFNQIPELLNDLREPDYCCLREDDDDDDSGTDINAWFGPQGTISPLHFDPKHNLLSQVVGEKLIIIYPPDNAQFLYSHPDNLLNNTAQVDPMCSDFEKFPEFRKATPHYCILKAGEMLYIPPKWWHYVKSLSVSFSVSFWWK